MRVLSSFIAFAIFFTSCTLASSVPTPAVDAATTTKPCQPTETYNAKFENLPTGAAPPADYQKVEYQGWTVVDSLSYASFNAKSGSNVIAADSEGAAIGNNTAYFRLKSFWFACSVQIYDEPNSAVPCDLEVISTGSSHISNIIRYGPFSYSQQSYNGMVANMTKVEIDGFAGIYYFNLASGISTSQLYLDNVVTEVLNYNC